MGHCNGTPPLTAIFHYHQYAGTRRLMHHCVVTTWGGQRPLGKTVKPYLGTFDHRLPPTKFSAERMKPSSAAIRTLLDVLTQPFPDVSFPIQALLNSLLHTC